MKPACPLLVCLSLTLGVAACWAQTAQDSVPVVATTVPVDAADMSARLATIPNDLPGWTIVAPPLICDAQCVGLEAPEDVELLRAYSFQWSLMMRFLATEPRQEIAAHIFRMSDDLNAFGLFSRHREAQTTPGQIATESFWFANSFHIWRGAFYIRLTAATEDKLLRAAVMAAGEAIAAKIPIPERLPLMMRLLPDGRRLPNTLRYYRQNALGQTAWGEGLVDTYLENREQLTFALLPADSDAAAVTLYATVLATLSNGCPATPILDLGKAATTFNSSQFGLTYVMREGRYVAVATNVHDRGTAEGLLRITGTNIRIILQ